jgi:hypothetical protein
MRKIAIISLAASAAATAFVWAVLPQQAKSIPGSFDKTYNNSALIKNTDIDIDSLALALETAGLPIGRVEKHTADDPWGYTVYIPQIHKNPASETGDKINDSAEITQKETYKMLDYLVNEKEMDFVMAEGDLYGEVPADKIGKLSEKIRLREELESRLKELKTHTANSKMALIASPVMIRGAKAIDFLDREIALAGAPYAIKAEGANMNLYGAENHETREECTHLVRDYIYQKDRISALSVNQGGEAMTLEASGANKTVSLKTELLKKLLSKNGAQNNPLTRLFVADDSREDHGRIINNGANDVGGLISEINEIYLEIEKLYSISANGAGARPGRMDNPYNSIDNPEELNKIHKETEKMIEEIVLEKRNREAAENFARALKQENENTGILQFGAAHEEGLVNELIKQGLSVIVISPNEVEK